MKIVRWAPVGPRFTKSKIKMKVSNFESASGNKVANQFLIQDGNRTVFQSYSSVIAIKENGRVTLDSYYWDYSKTTGKYRNMFLNETKAETQRKIDAGIYTLANLN